MPAVRNGLLSREHVAYCLAVNSIIGPQQKAVYNAMGPDISTVLLVTNPRKVVGVDHEYVNTLGLQEYIEKYWDMVDALPIKEAGIFRYPTRDGENTAEAYQPSEEDIERFFEDLDCRRQKGYWDESMIYRHSVERLLAIELKKIDVKKEDISFAPNSKSIRFEWAYPGETQKKRNLRYYRSDILKLGYNLDKVDCFYQKSLPIPRDTIKYIKKILPNLNPGATVLVGHLFKYNDYWDSNEDFKNDILDVLGEGFEQIDEESQISSLIDRLPEEDPDDPYNNYGMKLHIFRDMRAAGSKALSYIYHKSL